MRFTTDDFSYGDGGCIQCGHIQGHCEPDAQGYECESCGKPAVYGAAELVLMGRCDIGEDEEAAFDLI